jgi:hypothetical protein
MSLLCDPLSPPHSNSTSCSVEFDPIDTPQNPAPGALIAKLVQTALEHVLAVGTEVVKNAHSSYIRL